MFGITNKHAKSYYHYQVEIFLGEFGGQKRSFTHIEKFTGKNLPAERAKALEYYYNTLKGIETDRKGFYDKIFVEPGTSFDPEKSSSYSVALAFVAEDENDIAFYFTEPDGEANQIEREVYADLGFNAPEPLFF